MHVHVLIISRSSCSGLLQHGATVCFLFLYFVLSFFLLALFWLSCCLVHLNHSIHANHLMHACHSFLTHPSVHASHCIPAFHLGHVHLFNYASLWIMPVNCFMLILQFCLSFCSRLLFCSCLLCALYSLLVPSLSSGFYLQYRHEVKLLSLVAFCKKRCGIILCGTRTPSFSRVYTRYHLMYQNSSRGQLKLNKQYKQIL